MNFILCPALFYLIKGSSSFKDSLSASTSISYASISFASELVIASISFIVAE